MERPQNLTPQRHAADAFQQGMSAWLSIKDGVSWSRWLRRSS
jgi:hypothetical protein